MLQAGVLPEPWAPKEARRRRRLFTVLFVFVIIVIISILTISQLLFKSTKTVQFKRADPNAGLPPTRLLSIVPVFRTSLRESYTVPRVTTLRSTAQQSTTRFHHQHPLKHQNGQLSKTFQMVPITRQMIYIMRDAGKCNHHSVKCFVISFSLSTLLFSFRLKKSSLWSVDSNILDYRGFYVFRKTGAYDVGG